MLAALLFTYDFYFIYLFFVHKKLTERLITAKIQQPRKYAGSDFVK